MTKGLCMKHISIKKKLWRLNSLQHSLLSFPNEQQKAFSLETSQMNAGRPETEKAGGALKD